MISHPTSTKGIKPFDLTIIAISRGIASYLSYLHIKKQSQISSELLLRTPIVEICHSRGWQYECEFRLKNDPKHKRGAYKKIDFVLAYGNQLLGIEMKFPKKGSAKINVENDVDKVANILPAEKRVKDFKYKKGYLFFVGKEAVLNNVRIVGLDIGRVLDDNNLPTRMNKPLKDFTSFRTTCTLGREKYTVIATSIEISD